MPWCSNETISQPAHLKLKASTIKRTALPSRNTTYKLPICPSVQSRINHVNVIQKRRYRYAIDHPEEWINRLRASSISDHDIDLMLARKKALEFPTTRSYHEFANDIHRQFNDILGPGAKVIHMGSAIMGFSQNPRKGKLYCPTHIYREEGSDTDIKVYHPGFKKFLQTRTKGLKTIKVDGVEKPIWRSTDKTILRPEYNYLAVPELLPCAERWLKRGIDIQFALHIKPIKAMPWENNLHFTKK